MEKFKGLGVAMVTPFNEGGSIDYRALRNLTNHLVEKGADYLVVMGTTGENPTVNYDERTRIFDEIFETNQGRKPIVAGIGGYDTATLVKRLQTFDFEGVDAVLSVSPYYNKPNQAGLIRHYTKLADASPRPIILYNVPGRTGCNMEAETTLQLAEHENIIAMKEASGDLNQCMQIIRNKPEDFLVLSGDDALAFPLMSLGMDGVISVIGNAFPTEFGQMAHLLLEGKLREARQLHYLLLPLMEAIFEDGNPGGIKVVLEELGLAKNVLRDPLAPVNKELEGRLRAMVAEVLSGKQTV
jgi:4-hydroxy-tetrahydrodipicolinate synthase